MKTNNPFEDLQLEVSPKAVFQGQSTDAKNLQTSDAIDILKTINNADYDLLKVVRQYLRDKGAQKDTSRIKEIVDTFNGYSQQVLQTKLNAYKTEGGELSPLVVTLVKRFKTEPPAKLEEAVNTFSSLVKE